MFSIKLCIILIILIIALIVIYKPKYNIKLEKFNPPVRSELVVLIYCNDGYTLYTKNLLNSIIRTCPAILKNIHIICIDNKCFNTFNNFNKKRAGGKMRVILYKSGDSSDSKFHSFYKSGWDRITAIKMHLVSAYLDAKCTIVYLDGDIVILKDILPDILNFTSQSNIDLFIQDDNRYDKQKDKTLCTGMFIVVSNNRTRPFFRRVAQIPSGSDDQTHFNNLLPNSGLIYKILSRSEYPNGSFWYANSTFIKDIAKLVHFNWIKGHEKLNKIKEYGMWSIDS